MLRAEWAAREDSKTFARLSKILISASALRKCGPDRELQDYSQRYAFKSADFLVIFFSVTTLTVAGFAILKRLEPWTGLKRELLLDVLCAQGVGSVALKLTEKLAKQVGATTVRLYSVPHAIGFYRSQGYRNNALGKLSERREITNAAQQVVGLRFANAQEANANPKYRTFLKALVKYGTGANSCRGISLLANGCGHYGYSMSKSVR